jgi:hypothetical protein
MNNPFNTGCDLKLGSEAPHETLLTWLSAAATQYRVTDGVREYGW